MAADDLQRAFQIQKLYKKCLEKADSKSSYRERIAEAVAAMDEKLGPEWRKQFSPDGIDLGDIEEGGKAPEKGPACSFHERLRKAMLGSGLEVGQLQQLPEATESKGPVEEPKKKDKLGSKIKIAIEVG